MGSSARPAGAGHHRGVRAAGLGDRLPAPQAVADDRAAGGEVAPGELLDLLLAEALHHAQPQPPRPALGRGLDRRHKRRLAGRTPAALAPRPLAAEIGVVDLDPALKLGLPGLARGHRPRQLVLHLPGRGLLDAEPAPEPYRADPVLALRQVVDGGEPGDQRQLAVLEHRAGGERELLLAAVALEHLAGPQLAEAAVAAGRAGQPPAPAHPEQGLAARRLGAEPPPDDLLGRAPVQDAPPAGV